MIKMLVCEDIIDRANYSCFGVWCSEDKGRETAEDDGTTAHKAGFKGDV
jgi:hypothetical protein